MFCGLFMWKTLYNAYSMVIICNTNFDFIAKSNKIYKYFIHIFEGGNLNPNPVTLIEFKSRGNVVGCFMIHIGTLHYIYNFFHMKMF